MATLAELGDISKGLPSIMRSPGYVPQKLQAMERFEANKLGRMAGKDIARGSSGRHLMERGAMMRDSSRTGWTGWKGFGPKPMPPSMRGGRVLAENNRRKAPGWLHGDPLYGPGSASRQR